MSKGQRIMAGCMGLAATALVGWSIYELAGVFDPAANDTWTEFVSFTPPALLWTIIAFQIVFGILAIWSAGHYLETRSRGRHRR